MTNGVPQGRIAYDDTPDDIRRRIGRAYTGGRRTLEEQRKLGGNPDPRVCSVSSLHAFHCTPDADEYMTLQERCRSGELLCGECKATAADKLLEFFEKHRRSRDLLSDSTNARALALTGIAAKED